MRITIRQDGTDIPCEVNDGESIASAASRIGIKLLGACGGHGICNMCSRHVVSGIENILNLKTQKPTIHGDGYAPYARTCTAIPTKEGIVIDADRGTRLS